MKEIVAYGIDLVVPVNFEKLMNKEAADFINNLSGFIGIAPYAEGQTTAALFHTVKQRNEAYSKLLKKGWKVAVIVETVTIPVSE